MKNLLIICALLFSYWNSNAQECEAYAPFSEGIYMEMASYNAKGKLESTFQYTVTAAEEQSAQIHATCYDKKDKEMFEMDYNVMCEDSVFKVEMNNFIDPTAFGGDDFEMVFDGDFLEYPSGMQAGDELPGGDITVDLNSSGVGSLMNITVTVDNRKVEAVESITTSAGTFDCVKISYDFQSSMGFINVKGSSVEWIAKDIGVIRSESFNKKGKMTGYTELTKYDN